MYLLSRLPPSIWIPQTVEMSNPWVIFLAASWTKSHNLIRKWNSSLDLLINFEGGSFHHYGISNHLRSHFLKSTAIFSKAHESWDRHDGTSYHYGMQKLCICMYLYACVSMVMCVCMWLCAYDCGYVMCDCVCVIVCAAVVVCQRLWLCDVWLCVSVFVAVSMTMVMWYVTVYV